MASAPALAEAHSVGPAPDVPVTEAPRVERAAAAADEALIAKAEAAGSLPVIATLNLPFANPGTLSEADAAEQTARLREAQEAVIQRVLGGDRSTVKTFDFVPLLALTVTADQLAKLFADPAVAAVQEDAAVPPAMPQAVPAQ